MSKAGVGRRHRRQPRRRRAGSTSTCSRRACSPRAAGSSASPRSPASPATSGQTNYAACKAGVIGLVDALAAALAPRGHHRQRGRAGLHRDRDDARRPVGDPRGRPRLSSLRQGGLPVDVAETVGLAARPRVRRRHRQRRAGLRPGADRRMSLQAQVDVPAGYEVLDLPASPALPLSFARAALRAAGVGGGSPRAAEDRLPAGRRPAGPGPRRALRGRRRRPAHGSAPAALPERAELPAPAGPDDLHRASRSRPSARSTWRTPCSRPAASSPGRPLDLEVRAQNLRPHRLGQVLDVVTVVRQGGYVAWSQVGTFLRRRSGRGVGARPADAGPPPSARPDDADPAPLRRVADLDARRRARPGLRHRRR